MPESHLPKGSFVSKHDHLALTASWQFRMPNEAAKEKRVASDRGSHRNILESFFHAGSGYSLTHAASARSHTLERTESNESGESREFGRLSSRESRRAPSPDHQSLGSVVRSRGRELLAGISARRAVSGNRSRYVDDDYDLDLTYITDRIIAMAFPGEDLIGAFSTVIRNDLRQSTHSLFG
jgi:hypothetical protein